MNTIDYKTVFSKQLCDFSSSLHTHIAHHDEWTIRGFIDIFENIYTISCDTKVISKILELHLFPHFMSFAKANGYRLELASHQNWYPDLSFILEADPSIKFAVDLKTTYALDDYPGYCNGFTLGSHGEYFINRNSKKSIQYPYSQYSGHFCLGIIYSRAKADDYCETTAYSIQELTQIPPVIKHFIFFAVEKWRIASDTSGSGNTANIGSIQNIDDILNGNGVFANAGEAFCHKTNRFSKAYITKIVNQAKCFEALLHENDWQFLCQPFEKTISLAGSQSFIYCDPPYIGRHVDYFDSWSEAQEIALYSALNSTSAKYMLSTWDHNAYRKNPYIESLWKHCYKLNKEHYYFVGAKEANRNSIVEALLMNYTPTITLSEQKEPPALLSF